MIAAIAQLVLWALGVADVPPPVWFAAADTAVEVPVAAAEGTEVAVFALGKQLDGIYPVSEGRVRLDAPPVRARTVLELRPLDAERSLAQVVVYPGGAAPWPTDKLELLACGAPEWFEQWARAVGAPIRVFATTQELRHCERGTAEHRLIVLGRKADIEKPAETLNLTGTCAAHAVVLDAPWFRAIAPVEAVPKLDPALPPLPQLAAWTWRELPAFHGTAQPEMVWANRASIISDAAHVWVELFMQPDQPHVLVASYLPWAQHLGRSDGVDAFFAALLLETARAEAPAPFDRHAVIHGVDGPWPRPDRPDLSHLPQIADPREGSFVLHIVDLRGPGPSVLTARTIQPLLDDSATAPVLILGDDGALRSVRHLPEPGLPKKMPAEVIWLPDDRDDAAQEQQECLLRIVTAYNVPIIKPFSENKR